jgi:hypothetical protein
LSRWSFIIAFTAVMVIGCRREQVAPSATGNADSSAVPRASVALTVLVVNEPELAESIGRLRGEWAERSGGSLTVESQPWADVAKAKTIDADVVIFPLRYLGDLVESNRIRPVRESVLKSELYDAEDVLPLARQKLGVYGGKAMALPLGVQVPLAGFELVGRRETDLNSGPQPRNWPTRESVAHWSALMLLARAAGYASHPRQEAVLFDPRTMSARIADPPFVRALDEWRQENAVPADSVPNVTGESLVWMELPGAVEVFNRSTGEWESVAGGERRVPLLVGGQLLAVTAASRNAASAFDLATWLASPEIARQLGAAGTDTLPVRRTLAGMSPRRINSPAGRIDGSQLGGVLRTALSRDEALVVLRIPGADEYLAVLSAAVDKALRGEAPTADALAAAAHDWDQITDRLGRDSQRRAYLNDLGIERP